MHRDAVIITDLHLRADVTPVYLDKQLETLNRIVTSKHYDYILILGDVFEHRTTKSIVLVKFYDWLNSLKQEKFILRGNHDTCYKGDNTESVLKLYSNVAKVIVDREDTTIFKTPVTFIPHFESESIIKSHLKTTQSVTFGHFGFKNAISSYGIKLNSEIYQAEFKNLTFLGHIHKNMDYGSDKRIHIVGNQYTTNYGETGQNKYYYDLVFHEDGSVSPYKKKLEFGIKHVSTDLVNLEKAYKGFNPNNFFIFLRVKIDNLDKFKEEELRNNLKDKYKFDILDIKFEDLFGEENSQYKIDESLFRLNDAIFLDYLDKSNTPLDRKKLLEFLFTIRNDN